VTDGAPSRGPLAGLRVVEMAGLGPTPHAAMVLADLGADVVQVRRPVRAAAPDGAADADALLWRGRRVVEADLKDAAQVERVLDLVAHADVVIEGFRPGVMERLGLGPDVCLERHPGLVYARMTGWGQEGAWSGAAGHDINYLAVTGVLEAMGPAGAPPVPPLNLVGDFGGGSMLLVVGVMAALWERRTSGRGQVVDAAMTDGVNLLAQLAWSWRAAGRWSDQRGDNLLDGSAPFYATYACRDGYVAVGALEPQFWDALVRVVGLEDLPDRWDRRHWPALRAVLAERLGERTRAEWVEAFDGTDACVTPVLSFAEAPDHAYAQERGSFVTVDGHVQAAPAPRFSRSTPPTPGPLVGADLGGVLDEWSDGGGRTDG
jgi:alpha-methylacyl-CoA racemase